MPCGQLVEQHQVSECDCLYQCMPCHDCTAQASSVLFPSLWVRQLQFVGFALKLNNKNIEPRQPDTARQPDSKELITFPPGSHVMSWHRRTLLGLGFTGRNKQTEVSSV